MQLHAVGFADTAKHDVLAFIGDPTARVAFVRAVAFKLGAFPRSHRPCPVFGVGARSYLEGEFTVIFDVADDAGDRPGPVAVRHVWPSRGKLVAELLGRQ